MTNGDRFSGIFAGASLETVETGYLLKMVKRRSAYADGHANGIDDMGSGYVGSGPEHAMSFDMKDVAGLVVEGLTLVDASATAQNGSSLVPVMGDLGLTRSAGTPVGSAFRTDADIAAHHLVRERTLQRWKPSPDIEVTSGALDDSDPTRGGPPRSNRGWDQFEANKRLYGITTDYDENFYTTTIDRSDPLYQQRSAAAEKIAREIEEGNALNAHVAEERGLLHPHDRETNDEDR